MITQKISFNGPEEKKQGLTASIKASKNKPCMEKEAKPINSAAKQCGVFSFIFQFCHKRKNKPAKALIDYLYSHGLRNIIPYIKAKETGYRIASRGEKQNSCPYKYSE